MSELILFKNIYNIAGINCFSCEIWDEKKDNDFYVMRIEIFVSNKPLKTLYTKHFDRFDCLISALAICGINFRCYFNETNELLDINGLEVDDIFPLSNKLEKPFQ